MDKFFKCNFKTSQTVIWHNIFLIWQKLKYLQIKSLFLKLKTNSILANCALVLVAGAEIGWPESVIFCQKKRSWKRRMSSRDNGKVHGQWGTPTAHCNLELFRLWSLHYFVVLLSIWWCHKTGQKLGQFWQVYFDKICSTLIYFVGIDLVFHSFCNNIIPSKGR